MMSKAGTIASVLVAASAVLATNVHVNSGCILVSGNPICAGSGKGSPIAISGGKAKIHARFSGNAVPYVEYSGCVLDASWPPSWGDIYYGDDNCLYDAGGNSIGGQCCYSGHDLVRNPYNVWYG